MESPQTVAELPQQPTEPVQSLIPLYALLVFTMILWGGTWPAGRIVAKTMNPWNAAFIRFFIATVPMIWFCMRGKGWSGLGVERRHLPRLILLGFTGIFGYSAFFFSGLQTTDAARGALIIGCIPACISLISIIFMGERIRWYGGLGIALALIGVATVISNGSPSTLIEGSFKKGDLLIVGCVVCWTAYTLIGRPLMKEVPALRVATWACIFGTLFLAPFAIYAGVLKAVTETTSAAWLGLVYLAIGGTSLAYYWYYHALNQLGSVRTGIFINLVPVFGVLFGLLALKETLPLSLAAGGILVITGVSLTVRAGRSNNRKTTSST